MKITHSSIAALAAGTAMLIAAPASAKDDAVELVTCQESLGTIALVDSPDAGWAQWNLGSPRALIAQLAAQSGCFTMHQAGSSEPARYLVTAIAGSQEEVDQGVDVAKGVATEALLRSGAAGSLLSSVPFGGAALGMLGGLGGKKKTVAAGLTVVSPANGQPLAAGTGSVKSSSLTFRGAGGAWARGVAETTGYADSRDGQKLTEAFVIAFNQLVAQRAALRAAPAVASAAPAQAGAVVAVDTAMMSGTDAGASEVRALRAGTELAPTGRREGLWIEVADNYGTRGWVSVEDLQ